MPEKLDLKALRRATGLSNRQLAEAAGVELRTLQAYRDGERTVPLEVHFTFARLQHPEDCPLCGQRLPPWGAPVT